MRVIALFPLGRAAVVIATALLAIACGGTSSTAPGTSGAKFPGTAVDVALYNQYACALATVGGDIWCWGAGDLTPKLDGSFSGHTMATLSSGAHSLCGVTTGGDAICPTSAVPVTSGLSLVAVQQGNFFFTGIASDGTVWAWGNNIYGLGTGYTGFTGPVGPNKVLTGPYQSIASSAGTNSHDCALHANGSASCWGQGSTGEVGGGVNQDNNLSPVAVVGMHAFMSITVGGAFTCAVTTAGDGYCWGAGGRLGNGTSGSSSVPVLVAGGHHFTSIAAGIDATCALVADGSAWCWGSNTYGQIGNGRVGDCSGAVPCYAPDAVVGGVHFKAIRGGAQAFCGLATDNSVWCWGYFLGGSLPHKIGS